MTSSIGTAAHEWLERATRLDNPYWDAVKDDVSHDEFYGLCVGNILDRSRDEKVREGKLDKYRDRGKFTMEYAWTITDPDSLAFVARHVTEGPLGRYAIDPMAGSGYWAKLLIGMGVDVCSYDNHSWTSHVPHHHVIVLPGEAPQTVRRFPNHTLLLMWPPYSNHVGFQTVRNYRRDLVGGQRIIYIGEGRGGCTGDDEMHDELDEYWDLVATHRPVQWFGMHDDIYVYDRKR